MIETYQTVEPFLAGWTYGFMPGLMNREPAPQYFVAAVAAIALGFNGIPMSGSARVFSATALACGAAFLNHKVEWVRDNKEPLIDLFNLATVAIELYQGPRLYPLYKLAGIIGQKAAFEGPDESKSLGSDGVRLMVGSALIAVAYASTRAAKGGLALYQLFKPLSLLEKTTCAIWSVFLVAVGALVYQQYFDTGEVLGYSFQSAPQPAVPARPIIRKVQGCYK